jgi:hypothetical protein
MPENQKAAEAGAPTAFLTSVVRTMNFWWS